MNDLYLKLANTYIGKGLFDALNLPAPATLIRTPEQVLSQPSGRVLIASTKNNIAYKHLLSAMDLDTVKLTTPSFDPKLNNLILPQTKVATKQPIDVVNFDSLASQYFKAIILDATGMTTSDDLNILYLFLHPVLRQLNGNGSIVIVGRAPQNTATPEQAATHSALLGFVKSLAKEVGKTGTTCNLLQLDKGGEAQLQAALYYFLSPKSAYVTGQLLVLQKPASTARKINWQKPLNGKTAIVTGAAQGIGKETALVLARDGATVVCLDIPANEGPLKKLANSIGGHSLAVDLGAPDASEQIMNIIRSQLGVIDIMVHNAGITRDKTLAKMPEHFWNQVININLEMVLKINRLLLDKKAFRERGRIVCISSVSGIAGNFGQTNYASSKAGIIGYVSALSRLTEQGLTINGIAPGFIETEMTRKIPLMTRELGRRINSLSQGGLPIDVAEAVSFFCHPASQGLNGNVLRVCGQSLMGS